MDVEDRMRILGKFLWFRTGTSGGLLRKW